MASPTPIQRLEGARADLHTLIDEKRKVVATTTSHALRVMNHIDDTCDLIKHYLEHA